MNELLADISVKPHVEIRDLLELVLIRYASEKLDPAESYNVFCQVCQSRNITLIDLTNKRGLIDNYFVQGSPGKSASAYKFYKSGLNSLDDVLRYWKGQCECTDAILGRQSKRVLHNRQELEKCIMDTSLDSTSVYAGADTDYVECFSHYEYDDDEFDPNFYNITEQNKMYEVMLKKIEDGSCYL
jgi:hypothetical protein